MKWKATKEGTVRHRRKFLWWPIRCRDGYWRWLEFVNVTEHYKWYPEYGRCWVEMDHKFNS